MTEHLSLPDLAQQVHEVLKKSGKTLSLAESCTGGLVAGALTDLPGISSVFWGGAVVYSNQAKQILLGVSAGLLDRDGAVSPACAAAMAEGLLHRSQTSLALSITGIAGPGGGSEEKPVGLVWFGLSTKEGTWTYKEIFPGSRSAVRHEAARKALGLALALLQQGRL